MKKVKHQQVFSIAKISRRSFICSSLSIVIAGSLLSFRKNHTKQSTEEKLLSILNIQSSQIIGQTLINSTIDKSNLIAFIMKKLDLSDSSLDLISTQQLSIRLKKQTEIDFDSGNIISASGWMLGYTESQLCILAALKSKKLNYS